VFATQWLGLPPQAGKHFALQTGSVCILGEDAGFPAIRKWNIGATDIPNIA
jgi:probable phosphoglycerate mutase